MQIAGKIATVLHDGCTHDAGAGAGVALRPPQDRLVFSRLFTNNKPLVATSIKSKYHRLAVAL